MRCSIWWWNVSADINVWPGWKYFRVADDAYPPSELTSLRRAVHKYQLLFCAEQLSNQKMKSFVSQIFLIKLTNVLATFTAIRLIIPSSQSTPVALSFPFFHPPTGANVLLNTTIRLQKTTTFNPGSADNMMTFCVSTDTTLSLLVQSRFFSARYFSLALVAVLKWSSKSTQSAQSANVGFLVFPCSSSLLKSCLSNLWSSKCLSWRSHYSDSSSPSFAKVILVLFYFLVVICLRYLNILISATEVLEHCWCIMAWRNIQPVVCVPLPIVAYTWVLT